METNWTFLLNAFLVLYLKNIKGIEITVDKGTWCFPNVQHKNNPRRPRESVWSSSQANCDVCLGTTLVNNEPDKYNIVQRDNSSRVRTHKKKLRRCCSPIGHNNTKHFLCPIRSQHSLDRLEMIRYKESVTRGSSARAWILSSRLFSRPLGLRGCIKMCKRTNLCDNGKKWCGKYIILSINLNISVHLWYLDCKLHKFFVSIFNHCFKTPTETKVN